MYHDQYEILSLSEPCTMLIFLVTAMLSLEAFSFALVWLSTLCLTGNSFLTTFGLLNYRAITGWNYLRQSLTDETTFAYYVNVRNIKRFVSFFRSICGFLLTTSTFYSEFLSFW